MLSKMVTSCISGLTLSKDQFAVKWLNRLKFTQFELTGP